MRNNLDRLQEWTTTLSNTVANALPAIESHLDGKVTLPKNCPSKESAALMELGQVEKKLKEVNAAVEDIRDALLKPATQRDNGH